MTCEMCGNERVVAVVKVEGVSMTVCEKCAKHGTLIRNLQPEVKSKKTTARPISAAPVREELIETVVPNVAALLRAHREKQGLTPEKFAAKIGVRLSTYHHYESGSATPDIPDARKLEHELKKPLVVKVKVIGPEVHKQDDVKLTLGDFIKKKGK